MRLNTRRETISRRGHASEVKKRKAKKTRAKEEDEVEMNKDFKFSTVLPLLVIVILHKKRLTSGRE